jgi:DNA-binding CsgD family transcriptional regulator
VVIRAYARRGLIDHQTLSFDAYVKFIEDDFLGGQRLDPKTDGRPDPRPTVREAVPALGDLTRDFDFSQSPHPPVILSVNPRTDLIGPAPGSPLPRPGGGGAGKAVDLSGATPFVIRAAAASLGLTGHQLRQEIASGKTMSQIAREHGMTLSGVRQAVLMPIRAQLESGAISAGSGGLTPYVIRAAAGYLGLTAPDLRAALASGTKLSQIASQHGKTLVKLSQAVLSALQTQIDTTLR